MDKVILTAAITGSRMTRDVAPHIPITPEEITTSAVESWRAGASIVHLHVRDPETGLGSQDVALFRRVVEPIREKTDLILSLTTSGVPGGTCPTEERCRRSGSRSWPPSTPAPSTWAAGSSPTAPRSWTRPRG